MRALVLETAEEGQGQPSYSLLPRTAQGSSQIYASKREEAMLRFGLKDNLLIVKK